MAHSELGGLPDAGWDVEAVCAWVATVERVTEEVVSSFRTNDIDGAALLELTTEQLKDDLNVTSLGVRMAIMRAWQPGGIRSRAASDPGGARRQSRVC